MTKVIPSSRISFLSKQGIVLGCTHIHTPHTVVRHNIHTLCSTRTPETFTHAVYSGVTVSLQQTWLLILARGCMPDCWQPAWLQWVLYWGKVEIQSVWQNFQMAFHSVNKVSANTHRRSQGSGTDTNVVILK